MSAAERSERPEVPPGPYLVVGLARSGTAVARLLAERGAGAVIGCDAGRPGGAAELEALGVEVHLATDGVELLDRARTVVKSPGVPPHAPVIERARERGIETIGELELAWRLIPNETIAVTGTNGKTTTVELLAGIHRRAGVPVAVGGNIGTPLSSLVGKLEPETVVVCEVSSFQLESAPELAPDCAVLVNLGQDHLDYHGGLTAYHLAKFQVFRNQRPGSISVSPGRTLIIPPEPPPGVRGVLFGPFPPPWEKAYLKLHSRRPDLALIEGMLVWNGAPLLEESEVRLRGRHNVENAMAAAAAALARGIDREAVRTALREARGLPHRLEEVAELDRVLYVNDSKATNFVAAQAGIESFPGRRVHAILGGRPKETDISERLRKAIVRRCRACYLIGDAAPMLQEQLAGTVPLHECGELDAAVRAAADAAWPGDVVLLSPGCASFDQYEDFEDRGEHFRQLAEGVARRLGLA